MFLHDLLKRNGDWKISVFKNVSILLLGDTDKLIKKNTLISYVYAVFV